MRRTFNLTCGVLSRRDEIWMLLSGSNTLRSPVAIDLSVSELVDCQPFTWLPWDISPNPQFIPHIDKNLPTAAPLALLRGPHHKRCRCRHWSNCIIRNRGRLDNLSALVLRLKWQPFESHWRRFQQARERQVGPPFFWQRATEFSLVSNQASRSPGESFELYNRSANI